MTPIPRDAPASIACGRSGLPLLAVCANRHRRLVPFRLLKTFDDDRSPLHARPFRCRTCDSREVAFFLVDDRAELDALRLEISGPAEARPTTAPTNAVRPVPAAEL